MFCNRVTTFLVRQVNDEVTSSFVITLVISFFFLLSIVGGLDNDSVT
jgi:hypothetical protein